MSTLAEAYAAGDHQLSEFEGRQVIRAAIEIPNAAGGLREAMKIAPVELAQGGTVYVLLETTVEKVRFDPVKGAEEHDCRVHVLKTELATIVDGAFAKEYLDQQRIAIQKAKDAAAGQGTLDVEGDADKGDGNDPGGD